MMSDSQFEFVDKYGDEYGNEDISNVKNDKHSDDEVSPQNSGKYNNLSDDEDSRPAENNDLFEEESGMKNTKDMDTDRKSSQNDLRRNNSDYDYSDFSDEEADEANKSSSRNTGKEKYDTEEQAKRYSDDDNSDHDGKENNIASKQNNSNSRLSNTKDSEEEEEAVKHRNEINLSRSYSDRSRNTNSKYSRQSSYKSSEPGDDDDDDDDEKDIYNPKKPDEASEKAKKKENSPANGRVQSKPKSSGNFGNNKRKGRGRGRGGDRGGGPRNNNTGDRGIIVDRVLSANRNKARALHNVIYELQQQIESLSVENKDLKRAARLQDREIRKMDNAEAELPVLLQKHSGEMRVLQEKYKRQKEASDKAREGLKRRDDELFKVKEKLRKYENMVKEKDLGERSSLNKKLQEIQKKMEEKDKKIAELSRSVQLHEKVRARELKEKNEKYRKAVEEMKRLEHEQRELLRRLKDKEKALEVTNIYSQRLQRRGSKESEATTNYLFTPSDPVPPVIKRHQDEQEYEYAQSIGKAFMTEKDTAMSERTPGKMITIDFEDENQKKHKKKQIEFDLPKHHSKPVKTLVNKDREKEENEEEFYRVNEKNKQVAAEQRKLEEVDRKLAELKRREEFENQEEERKQTEAEKELEERIAGLEQQRLERERQLREQGERNQQQLKQEEEDREREEIARKEQERLDREERRKHEDCERNELEKRAREEEQEKQKQELIEKRKKKELLLAKMHAIDCGEDPNDFDQSNRDRSKQDRELGKAKTKKPIFLESSTLPPKHNTEDEVLSRGPLDFSSKPNNSRPANIQRRNTKEDIFAQNSERKNSWEFKRTDENMHRGLPSQTNVDNSPTLKRRNTKDSDELSVGDSTCGSGKGRRHRGNDVEPLNNAGNGSTLSGDKKGRRANLFDDNIETSYSPTAFNDSPRSQNNKSNKKNTRLSPFDQFEDPFQPAKKDNNKNRTNNLVFSSEEDEDDYETQKPKQNAFSKPTQYNKRLKTPDRNFGDDDVEEMILA